MKISSHPLIKLDLCKIKTPEISISLEIATTTPTPPNQNPSKTGPHRTSRTGPLPTTKIPFNQKLERKIVQLTKTSLTKLIGQTVPSANCQQTH
jgi:hypothetical protein